MNNEEKRLMVRRIINQIAESNNVRVIYTTLSASDVTEATFYYGNEKAHKHICWPYVVDNAKEYTTYRLLRSIEKTIEHLKEDVDNIKPQIIASWSPYNDFNSTNQYFEWVKRNIINGGNNHEYYDIFKHWLKKFDKQFTVFKKVHLTNEDVIAPWKGVDLPKLELDLDKFKEFTSTINNPIPDIQQAMYDALNKNDNKDSDS